MENTNQPNSGNENTSTPTDGNVNISQEQLNDLINKKYAKGAEKAKADLLESLGVPDVDTLKSVLEKHKEHEEASKSELEKAQELLATLTQEKDRLTAEMKQTQFNSNINALAAKEGIKEIDYFTMEYSKASDAEDFKVEDFIGNLRESKPFVFGQQAPTPPKTDNSSNSKGEPASWSERVKNATTKQELDALYAELNN